MVLDARKKPFSAFIQSKLSIKLILSHLLVALGSLLVLIIVISVAIQSYFINSQYELIHAQSLYAAPYYENLYLRIGSSWDHILPFDVQSDGPSLLIIEDQSAHIIIQQVPRYLSLSQAETSLIQQNMTKALAGETVTGYLQDGGSQVFSGYYACLPLTVHGQIIGAMLFAHPEVYPQGFSPNSFLTNVSTALLFSGAIIALIVAFSSLFFVHRLTRPLVIMKYAVDKLSAGNYAERIPGPLPTDELGQLALSFNNMARQIKEDIDALQRQEHYRREITANIAHDLSTPLASIQGFSEALADGLIQDEQARSDAYNVIIRESGRLSLLIKDIQQLSSLESGQLSFDYAPVDLATLVKETVEVIARQCEEAGIALQNNIEQNDELLIYADSNRIIQVLLNLFDNARHHTLAGGTITIESALDNEQVTLWIKDTGHGIAPEDLPHIFDRFYRADPSRTYATGGSGLGLAIVKTIVTLHGGTIHAESIPGQGTTVIMAFRAASTQAT
ncbi:MAG: HAMP domain-containing sensor histidine kinase [Ktedonobacteraceae bacterium]